MNRALSAGNLAFQLVRARALTEFETTFGDRLNVPKGHRRSCPESVLPIQQQS
jgi:hypothetical protein